MIDEAKLIEYMHSDEFKMKCIHCQQSVVAIIEDYINHMQKEREVFVWK